MAVRLLRCSGQWVKIGHPCWRVEKALIDMAIEFENGIVYREGSRDMERTIRAGKLFEKAGA